jgi:hypothetical protein
MLDIQGYSVAYGETLPMDIWYLYMADATSVELGLGSHAPTGASSYP